VAFALHAAAASPDTSDAELRGALGHGADVCRTSMTRMRELLADLRSPHGARQDLHAAIDALAQPLRAAGADVTLRITARRPLQGDTALLMHRAAREILLDARNQPDLTTVTVELVERAGDIVLTVEYESVGLDASGDVSPPGARLQSLADRLSAAGGSLTVGDIGDLGTRVTATLPAT